MSTPRSRRRYWAASKAGLSLRLPLQWPKRAIGTFGRLRPDPPKAPSFKHGAFGNPFFSKWIPKACLWRSLRQSLNLASCTPSSEDAPIPDPDPVAAGERLRLAELLAARLSHDLAGLAGVLAAALELAADDPDPAEALALARDAAGELAARLRLLRAAWAGDGGDVSRRTLEALVPGLGGRLRVDLSALDPGAFPAGLSRLLPNLLLLGAEALPRGGALTLSGSPAGVTLAVEGAGAGWPPALRGFLAAPHTAWTITEPRQLQPALLVLLAGAAGLALRFEGSAGTPALHVGR